MKCLLVMPAGDVLRLLLHDPHYPDDNLLSKRFTNTMQGREERNVNVYAIGAEILLHNSSKWIEHVASL